MNKDCKLTVKGIELLFALLLVLTISHSADAQNYDAYENITEVFENWTWTHYGVNLSIKFCDAFDCVDNPAFTEYEDISDYSNYHGQYFQYRALLFTDNASRSPRLRNVTVEATTSPTTYKTVYDVFQSFSFLGNREREIKLQVRSCRLSDCSDNSEFIGQDGTPGSYFEFPQANPDHEANFNNLSKVPIASNRYFQYKAYLTTDDTSKTPKLWNVTVNSTAVTNGSNKSLTVKLWLYRESGSITQEPILCRWDSVSDVNRTYCLLLDSNGKARFYLSSDGVSSGVVISSSTIPAGQWTSIAATYDDSTDQLKIYINAIREDNITWIHGISENNSRILIGGGDFGEFRRYLNGDIDEVRIYNRSLSAEEIRLSYGSSL
ncbi:MAG: LamG domain-containing protein, partial [Candidatus Altiarchaeota archaeon]|nr:LamG domain-containing protein [Candidatus Altiarchaeota archaeon]